MRTPARFVHRYLALTTLGGTLLFACGGAESKKAGSDAAGSDGAGSGNASTSGGSSSGGSASTTGGDGSGGSTSSGGSTENGGSDSSGGGGGNGGTDPGTGGASTGGDAGTPATGGAAGTSNGGNGGGGTAGNAGSGSAGTPSAGCRAGGSPASGRFSIDASGTMREYILKLPTGYDSTHPYRLVFAFHGARYSAQTVADGGPPGSGPYYGIEALSGGSTIFVATQALSSGWSNQNDLPYVNAMVARFKAELCLDETRIFVTGFSAGAIMTITIGCNDQAGVFRAIAPMSGSLPSSCPSNRPLAYFSSHGTNDTTITPANGMAARDEFIDKNGCSTTTMPGDRDGCVNYQGCDAGAPVTWCTFAGAHEPPPYAGEAIWAFFSQF